MKQDMKACSATLLALLVVGVPHDAAPQSARPGSPLRVGAAKVEVTPAGGELPKNSRGVLDRLYARAIVLESGGSSAASAALYGDHKTVQCPGRERTSQGRAGFEGTYTEGARLCRSDSACCVWATS